VISGLCSSPLIRGALISGSRRISAMILSAACSILAGSSPTRVRLRSRPLWLPACDWKLIRASGIAWSSGA
jgi:hypothetical protein